MSSSPIVVVAYDGSIAARAALALAVERVGDGRLFVVHAYDAPKAIWGAQHAEEVLDRALQRGEDLLDAVGTVEPRLADVDYETELIAGNPAEVVAGVAEVRGADEIVLGTRGFGPLRGVVGSVAHAVLHLSPCPVTVIPERAVAEPAPAGAQIATA